MLTMVFTRDEWLARIAKHVRGCRKCRYRERYNAGRQMHPLPQLCLRWMGMKMGLRACELIGLARGAN